MTPDLCVVVGMSRSGTSLLHSMLAANPTVAALPETSFIRRFVLTGSLAAAEQDGTKALASMLESDTHFCRLGLTAEAVLNSAAEQTGTPIDAAAYRAIIHLKAHGEGRDVVVDKDPRAVEYLPVLEAIWPGASVVCTIRDPRDVLLSRKKAAWSRDGNLVRHLLAIRSQADSALLAVRSASHRSGARALIRYEDLLGDSETVLRQLCTDLNLDYSADMLQFSRGAEKLVAKDEMDWKKETLGPLLSKNVDKWKSELPDTELALLEFVCKSVFEKGQYARSGAMGRLSPIKRIQTRMFGTAISVAYHLYCRYRGWQIQRAVTRLR